MEGTLAQIMLFAGNFAPKDWMFCAGQLLPIAKNTALFALLGTTYGGDGKSTFALPDLREKDSNGHLVFGYQVGKPSSIICIAGMFPMRADLWAPPEKTEGATSGRPFDTPLPRLYRSNDFRLACHNTF